MLLVVCVPESDCVSSECSSCPRRPPARPPSGALVGNVSDESGGAVPGATITATETRTNISRTAVSNAAGNYTFTNLASGLYRVEGELVGFRKFSRENVEVNVNTHDSRGHLADRR